MEKTKAELYMDRLQKWREEKQKKKVENKSNKQIPAKVQKGETNIRRKTFTSGLEFKSTTTNPRAVITKSNNKPPQPIKSKSHEFKPHTKGPTITKPLTSLNKTNKAIGVSQKLPVSQVVKPKPVGLTPGSSRKAPTGDYLQKFQQWKEEKEKTRSEKKILPGTCRSTVKNEGTSHCPAKSTEKPVKAKSRLFHSQHLDKTKTDKENKTVPKRGEHLTHNVSKQTSGIKRRRSFTVQGPPAKRNPVGILKRKSCVGFYDFDIKGCKSDSTDEVHKKTKLEQGDVCPAPISPKTPSRNVRFISPNCTENSKSADGKALRKTPLKRQNLNDWLESNDKTPSKFRHLLCFHADHQHDPVKDLLAKSFLSIEELADQANALEMERLNAEAMKKLESMLEECMTLFEAGCPSDAILPWLDDIYNKIPIARTSVKFYKCKVDVLKESLDLDAVLQLFEEATINDAQPKTELAKMLTETVKYVTDKKVKLAVKTHRTRRRSKVQEENVFASSAIVYTVGNVTPFSDRKQRQDKDRPTDECQVVTPVRRSTRRSLQNLPESLKEKRRTLTSLTDLEDRDNVLFKPNLALEKELEATDED